MCGLCANRVEQVSRHWQNSSATASLDEEVNPLPTMISNLPPPDFTLDQISKELQTNWGDAWQGRMIKWDKDTITYAMPDAVPTNYGTVPLERPFLVRMSDVEKAAAREAFELWDDLIAKNLVEDTANPTGADITVNHATQVSDGNGNLAWGTTVGPRQTFDPAWGPGVQVTDQDTGETYWQHQATGSQIWVNSLWWAANQDDDVQPGQYGNFAYVHEIGHALGLSHPGAYDSRNGGTFTFDKHAEYSQDGRKYTVMSYFGGWAPQFVLTLPPPSDLDWESPEWEFRIDGTEWNYLYPQTPMLHDIAVIQAKYGADTETRKLDTIYGFNSTADRDVYDFSKNQTPILTIWDAGGVDWLNASGFEQDQTVDLREGYYSSLSYLVENVAIAFGAKIENAMGGSGDDTLYGNALDNTLDGNVGADRMTGFGGDDTYVVNDAGDVVVERSGMDFGLWGNGGIDTVASFIDGYTLGDNVENLELAGMAIVGVGTDGGNETVRAGGGDDVIVDYHGVNQLYGEAGKDWIISATTQGSLLDGGSGDDILSAYFGGNTLIGGEGNDRLENTEGGPLRSIFTGGADADTFVYRPGVSVETEVLVTDFQDGVDHIGLDYWASFDQLTITDSAEGAVIEYSGTSPMVLAGIGAHQLTQDDFLLAA